MNKVLDKVIDYILGKVMGKIVQTVLLITDVYRYEKKEDHKADKVENLAEQVREYYRRGEVPPKELEEELRHALRETDNILDQ